MSNMKKIDHLKIDGHTLTTFLTVLEEASVSKAAKRLNLSQSAVSHTLDSLRKIFDDPLFVRVGRGIEPTARAIELRGPVEEVLDGIKNLNLQRDFDPLVEKMEFTIAANDFPTQLIFPKLLREIADEGANVRVRFISSGIPRASSLRASRYRLLITPAPPDDPGLIKQSLLKTPTAIFYDASIRTPPETWEEYFNCEHVEVRFSDTESSMMALPAMHTTGRSPPVVTVSNFSSLPHMIKGTNRIATILEVMKLGLMSELDMAQLPIAAEPIDLFLIWHQREHDDPAHLWFRERIIETTKSILMGHSIYSP
jgi:DNA-binding transcriptional LysR family regulator